MKNAIALTLAAVAVVACSTTKDTTATIPSFAAPRVTAPGPSPINPGKQPAFCQDQVAFMYEVEPQNVTAGERVVAEDGSTTIDVTVDQGNESVRTFKCRLDADSRFLDVMATTSDGML